MNFSASVMKVRRQILGTGIAVHRPICRVNNVAMTHSLDHGKRSLPDALDSSFLDHGDLRHANGRHENGAGHRQGLLPWRFKCKENILSKHGPLGSEKEISQWQ